MDLFLIFVIAMSITAVVITLLLRWSSAIGFEDNPSERKIHETPVPRVGGAGIVLGATVALAMGGAVGQHVVFLGCAAIIFLFGLWDDREDLDYRIKFLGQLLASCLLVTLGGVRIASLSLFDIGPLPDGIAIPLTVLALMAVTNAINLADGLDGLAGGLAFLSFGGIALTAFVGDEPFVLAVCLAVMGALTGFLRFNTYPAVIFMGDGGSQFLGFVLGALSLMLTQSERLPVSQLLPLFLIGLPIIDTVFVMAQRIRLGQSPFAADTNHVHHKLLKLGCEHHHAVAIIYALQAIFVYCAYFLKYESDLLLLAVYLTLAMTILLYLRYASGWRTAALLALPVLPQGSLRERWSRGILKGLVAALSLFAIASACLANSNEPLLKIWIFALMLISSLWFWYRRTRPMVGIERGLLYLVVTTLFYASQYSYLRSSHHAVAWDAFFVVLGVLVAIGFRFCHRDRLKLTPLDLLVGLVAVALPILPGTPNLSFGLLLAKLCILFYASEIILANYGGRSRLVRTATAVAAGSLGLRMLI